MRNGHPVKEKLRINRHAPLTSNGSFNQQTALLIEAALEEFSATL